MSEVTEEEIILFRLEQIREAYQRQAEPYLKRLEKIALYKPIEPVIINMQKINEPTAGELYLKELVGKVP
jgi:hypothetical protein